MKYTMWNDAYNRTFKTKQYKIELIYQEIHEKETLQVF